MTTDDELECITHKLESLEKEKLVTRLKDMKIAAVAVGRVILIVGDISPICMPGTYTQVVKLLEEQQHQLGYADHKMIVLDELDTFSKAVEQGVQGMDTLTQGCRLVSEHLQILATELAIHQPKPAVLHPKHYKPGFKTMPGSRQDKYSRKARSNP